MRAGQAAASSRSSGWEPSARPIQTGRLLDRYSGGVTHPGNPDAAPEVQSGSCGRAHADQGRRRPARQNLRFCASGLARPGGERCVGAHGSVPGSPRAPACMRRPRPRSVMTSQTSIARSWTTSLPSPRRNGSSPSRSTARPAPPARSRPARTQRSRAPVRWRRGRRPRRGTDESPEPGLRRTPEDRPAEITGDVIKTPHSDRKSRHCGTSTRDRKGPI